MAGIFYILKVLQITVYALIIVCSCVYLLPILLIRRFHTPINIITANVCVTISVTAVYWIVNYVLAGFFTDLYNADRSLCTFQKYMQFDALCQVAYALVLVSIHRLCIIVYSRRALMKTKNWAFMCVGTQWVFSAIVMLPIFVISPGECNSAIPQWFNVYVLVIICVLPSILLGLINTLIFVYARASTRRVVPIEGTMRNTTVPLTNRDIRALKHMLFMFVIFFVGWGTILVCIAAHPPWFNFSIFNYMQLLPALSMLIDMGDLFFYNHALRNYWKGKILTGQRNTGNNTVLFTVAQAGQPSRPKLDRTNC